MPRYKLSGWHLGDECLAVTFSAHVMSQGVKIVEEQWEMEIPRGVADLGDLGNWNLFNNTQSRIILGNKGYYYCVFSN